MAQRTSPLSMDRKSFATNPWAKDDQDFNHHQELAQQLVRHLGISGARQTCHENQWDGVLAAIDHAQ